MRNLYFRFYKYGRRRAFARDEQLPIQNRLSCGILLDVLENGVLFLLLHLLSHARIVYGHTAFSHIRYVSFAGGVSGHKRHSFDCKKLRIVCASVFGGDNSQPCLFGLGYGLRKKFARIFKSPRGVVACNASIRIVAGGFVPFRFRKVAQQKNALSHSRHSIHVDDCKFNLCL